MIACTLAAMRTADRAPDHCADAGADADAAMQGKLTGAVRTTNAGGSPASPQKLSVWLQPVLRSP